MCQGEAEGNSKGKTVVASSEGLEFEVSEVWEKYSKTLYGIALHLMKNVQDAEDARQEAFLKLMDTEADINDEDHLKAWLITVLRNWCFSLKQSAYCRRTILESQCCRAGMEEHDWFWNRICAVPYEDHEDAKELWEYVMKLKQDQRMVVVLYYYSGYSVREISQWLGVTEGATKLKLQRARKNLKSWMLG